MEGSAFKIVFNVSMAAKCNRRALKINRKLYLNHKNYITAALSKCTALSFSKYGIRFMLITLIFGGALMYQILDFDISPNVVKALQSTLLCFVRNSVMNTDDIQHIYYN